MVDYTLFNNEEEQPQVGLLKKSRAMIQSPGGVLSNTVQPGQGGMLPNAIDAYRSKASDLYQQGSDLYNQEPDFSQFQKFAKQRAQQGDAAMLNALAAQFAGESFAPVQEQYLKKAATSRDPMKMGSGVITAEGEYLKDPEIAQNKKAEFLLQQAKAYETMAATAETARERIASERKAREFEQMYKMEMLGLRRDMAANNSGGTFTQSGFTPDGKTLVTNKTGMNFVLDVGPQGQPVYTPYGGAAIPKATFEKNVGAAQTFQTKADSADALVKKIESNPAAFGITAAAVSRLPSAIQGRVGAQLLSEDTLKLRADVLRQAAMEISDIYGAAQSVGEAARAATFIPASEDPPQIVMEKLKAARDYARSNAQAFGGAINDAARNRSGGSQPPGGSGGLSANEQAELASLRAKHRKTTP
jgi:hypothetical protein